MRKLWVGSIGLVAAAIGPGWAADLPKRPVYKAPPPVVASVPLFSWTGCYLGGHVGGGWGRKEFSDPIGALFAPPGEGSASTRADSWAAVRSAAIGSSRPIG